MVRTKQRIMGLLFDQWLSEEERVSLLAAADVGERRGATGFDVRPLIVRKVLEVPARCRELVSAFSDSGATPQDFTDFMSALFKWVDDSAGSMEEANRVISRVCSESDIQWYRVSGGYLIRPAFGGPSRASVTAKN